MGRGQGERILSNERYAGRLPRNDGKVFETRGYRALIDAATGDACVRHRMSRPFPGRTNRAYRVYPLTGLLRCGRCGGTVSGWNRKHPERRTKRRYFYYTCYSRRVRAGSAQPFFPEEQLEAEVLCLLRAMAIPDGLAEAVEAAISSYASQQRKTSRSNRRKVIDQ